MTDKEQLEVCKAALALIMGDCWTVTEAVEAATEAMRKVGEWDGPSPRTKIEGMRVLPRQDRPQDPQKLPSERLEDSR